MVKPVTLLRWLARLVTPPGGTILDPFISSGSAGVAAQAEGFGYFGLELGHAYHPMPRGRLQLIATD